jgi:RNA-directed DNA polymerase
MDKSKTVKVEWDKIDWAKVQAVVFKLQKRIYKASLDDNVQKVRKLQKTLMRSWSNRVLAIRRVTQDNRGKKTAGIDGVKFISPDERMTAAENLKLLNSQTKMRNIMVEKLEMSDKSRATRRVWIPKADKKEMRPLGIPTMMERAKQALVKNALEPEWVLL